MRNPTCDDCGAAIPLSDVDATGHDLPGRHVDLCGLCAVGVTRAILEQLSRSVRRQQRSHMQRQALVPWPAAVPPPPPNYRPGVARAPLQAVPPTEMLEPLPADLQQPKPKEHIRRSLRGALRRQTRETPPDNA